jgi:hypothetical protein
LCRYASAPLTIMQNNNNNNNGENGENVSNDSSDAAAAMSLTVQLQPCVPINRLNFDRTPSVVGRCKLKYVVTHSLKATGFKPHP